jgi:hypothetical protein
VSRFSSQLNEPSDEKNRIPSLDSQIQLPSIFKGENKLHSNMGSKLERESTSIDVALVFQPFAATKCFLLHKIISEGGLSLLHG